MFPLRDNIPVRHKPYMVWTLMGINVFLFFFMLGFSPTEEVLFFHLHGVVPARFVDPSWALVNGYPPGGMFAFVGHMFLHSGWLHLIMNMWMLWIFGDNVEDVMGPLRFLIFYLLCGLGALFVHVITEPEATLPVVGASGAIAGVMGAYFFLYPHARVMTFFPIFIFPMFFEISAVFFLGAWFLTQIFSGMLSSGGAGVAWWAHIGGFVFGMLLLRFFRDDSRCYYCYRSETWKEWGS